MIRRIGFVFALTVLLLSSAVGQDDSQKTRKTAEQCLSDAIFYRGSASLLGEMEPADDQKAFKQFLDAAERGHACSQSLVGVMYRDGQGVPQDYQEALKWLRRAAEQGQAARALPAPIGLSDRPLEWHVAVSRVG